MWCWISLGILTVIDPITRYFNRIYNISKIEAYLGYPHRKVRRVESKSLDVVCGLTYLSYYLVLAWNLAWNAGFFDELAKLHAFGLVIHACFPTPPPWMFEAESGIQTIYGQEALLCKFDNIVGMPIFATIYSGNPSIFGSFPSLHVATSMMCYLNTPGFLTLLYMLTMSFSSMYTHHHWLSDVVGSALLCIALKK